MANLAAPGGPSKASTSDCVGVARAIQASTSCMSNVSACVSDFDFRSKTCNN